MSNMNRTTLVNNGIVNDGIAFKFSYYNPQHEAHIVAGCHVNFGQGVGRADLAILKMEPTVRER